MLPSFFPKTFSYKLLSIPLFLLVYLLLVSNVSAETNYIAYMVKDIHPGSKGNGPQNLINLNGTLYFTEGNDDTNNEQLWKSNGTADGTVNLTNFNNRWASDQPTQLTNINGTLFFLLNDLYHSNMLWKTDGTVAGTTYLTDFDYNGYGISCISNLVNLNGTAYVSIIDPIDQSMDLWKSDGTQIGTTKVTVNTLGRRTNYRCDLVNVNDTLFFISNDGDLGLGLWKSNGTEAGTTLVKDFKSKNTYAQFFLFPGNGKTLFFIADDGTHGYELWKSDGTTSGTIIVKDINPGPGDSYTGLKGYDFNSPFYSNSDGTLFFYANDGTHGTELWKSDGTDTGTVMIKDINPGSANSRPMYLIPEKMASLNGTLFFWADDGSHGLELWKTDGTSNGTILVKDIYPGITGSEGHDLIVVNGTLYFGADDPTHGTELWKSDGTETGTVVANDIIPGRGSSIPFLLTDVDGKLFFRAYDDIHGNELWSLSRDLPTINLNGGSLVDGSVITAGLTQFSVAFDKDVKHDGSANAANNPINYLLVEQGPNATFDTTTCALGRAGDDRQVTINSVAYNPSGFTATLQINNGNPLSDGTYRLFVCGTTSIEDLNGNKLNGGLSDAQINFTVMNASSAISLPVTGFTPGIITNLPPQPVNNAYTPSDLVLEIPSLNIKTAILGVPKTQNGWDISWLGENVGYLEGLAFPTTSGNSVLTGHVWNADNTPGLFNNLKNLRYGDPIKIDAWGEVYTYEVRENEKIATSDVQSAFKHEKLSWLTLLTCEDYQSKSNIYSSRRIARAVLVSVKTSH